MENRAFATFFMFLPRILLARLALGVFRYCEMLQRGFRAEEAGRDGEDEDAVRREFGGPLEREHLLRARDSMGHRVCAAADDVVWCRSNGSPLKEIADPTSLRDRANHYPPSSQERRRIQCC